MEGDGQLDRAEIGAEVAAGLGDDRDELLTEVVRERGHFGRLRFLTSAGE